MTEQSIDPGDENADVLAGEEVESDVDIDFDSFEEEQD